MIFPLKNILTFIECVLNKDFCQKISRDNSYAKWTFCLLCRVFMINEFHMYLFLKVLFFSFQLATSQNRVYLQSGNLMLNITDKDFDSNLENLKRR